MQTPWRWSEKKKGTFMNTEKIIGYLLLIAGIGIILASTFSLYQVFTGQRSAPSVVSFKAPTISLPTQPSLEFKLPEGIDLPEGMELPEGLSLPDLPTPGVAREVPRNERAPSAESQELKLLPDEAINSIANMSIYLLLMGFIASSGVKIAGIGVKMIKDIKVVVKEEKIKQVT